MIADPTQFEGVLRDMDESLYDPTGNYAKLPAAHRESLIKETRQNLALSAAQGG